MSLPLWERGLKSLLVLRLRGLLIVAPLVGAWIEMYVVLLVGGFLQIVAPLVGAWIEIGGVNNNCPAL